MNSFSNLKLPLWTLLGGVLLSHFGSYLVQPYLSIYLSEREGLTLLSAGLILAISSTAYIVSSFPGGLLADLWGRKWATFTGLVIRGIGLLGYAVSGSNISLLYFAAVLAGLGNGIYIPSAKSGISTLAEPESRTFVFSLRGIAANIGTTAGPVLGGFMFDQSTFVLFALAAFIYEALGIAHLLILPGKEKQGMKPEKPKITGTGSKQIVSRLLQDKGYFLFTLISILIWMLYTQLSFSVPLRMTWLHLPKSTIGWLWAISSLLIIFGQARLTKTISRLPVLRVLTYGTFLFAIGFATVAFTTGFWSLLGSVLLITLGEMLVMPTIDSTVSLFATDETSGFYFGIASVAFGIGDALGNYGGGLVMHSVTTGRPPAMPWLIYGGIGIVICITIYVTGRNPHIRRRLLKESA